MEWGSEICFSLSDLFSAGAIGCFMDWSNLLVYSPVRPYNNIAFGVHLSDKSENSVPQNKIIKTKIGCARKPVLQTE